MAAGDVEVVHRAILAYCERDLDALLPLLDPDVEVKSLLTEAERTAYRGHEGVREWFGAVFEVFPDWLPSPGASSEEGGGVVTELDVTATAVASGVPIHQGFWHAARVRDGRIAFFGFYRTREEARAALD
jgi:ketosteroid isomerase-like protein